MSRIELKILGTVVGVVLFLLLIFGQRLLFLWPAQALLKRHRTKKARTRQANQLLYGYMGVGVVSLGLGFAGCFYPPSWLPQDGSMLSELPLCSGLFGLATVFMVVSSFIKLTASRGSSWDTHVQPLIDEAPNSE